jgi:hypothetical protein
LLLSLFQYIKAAHLGDDGVYRDSGGDGDGDGDGDVDVDGDIDGDWYR